MSAYKNQTFNVDAMYTNVDYGLGWKLNYQQIIRGRGGNNYEYYDADGTMHYFHWNSSKGYSEDEDGLGLKLYPPVSSQYKMVDKNKTEMWFDHHGRLYKIVDNNGNITNIKIGNGNQPTVSGLPITEINDNQGRSITFTYSSYRLTTINYKRADGQTAAITSFAYDASGRISRITNDDSTYTDYVYDTNNNLIQLADESDYAIKFVTDKTLALDNGIAIPIPDTAIPWAKTRSVFESVGGGTNREWLHVSDNVYCDGLTLSVNALNGQTYVPYETGSDYSNLINEYMDSIPLATIILISLLIPVVGFLLILMVAHINVIEPYRISCMEYYNSNFRIKNVYDHSGRLVSSYIDDVNSLTAIETRYEQPASSGVNVNNNKPNASASYTPGIVNYIANGSFENGTTGWMGAGAVGGTPYRSGLASDKYAAQGKQSLEMFFAQPTSGSYMVYQSVTLPAGTYTLSGYIRVENALVPYSASANYGAFMRFYSYVDSEYVTADLFSNNDGFKYVSVTYKFTQQTSVYIDLVMIGCAGFAYFDQIQVVRNDYGTVNADNYVQNAGFESWSGTLPAEWVFWSNNSNLTTSNRVYKATASSKQAFAGNNSVELRGSLDGRFSVYQFVTLTPSSQSRAYTVSAWVNNKGRSYLPFADSTICMNINLYNAAGTRINTIPAHITSPYAVWHQISTTFVVPPSVTTIEISFLLGQTSSMLYVDNATITQSEVINYGYNSVGDNTFYSDGQKTYSYSENADNPAGIEIAGSIKYGIVKDAKGNVLSTTEAQRASKIQYTYDSIGRTTSQTFSSLNGTKKISSETSYAYIQNNLIESVTETDSLGFKTISNYYTYSGLLDKTTSNDNSYVEYIYANGSQQGIGNFPGQVKTITINDKSSSGSVLSTVIYEYLIMSDALTHADYGYRHVGMIKKVTMGNGTVYSYVYDKWGNVITVRLNGADQIIYEYRQSDGALIRKTVGGANGYTEYYSYNKLGRMVEMRAAAVPNAGVWGVADSSLQAHVYYEYAVSGALIAVRDTIDDKGYWYNYDTNGRAILKGEGAYTATGGSATIQTKTIFETVYDYYGDVYNTNIIDVDGVKSTFGISITATSLTGALAHVHSPGIERITVGGVEKIKYTHNYSGNVMREDNVFLNKSIEYTRNQYGKITSVLVGNYTTGTISGTAYSPFYSVKSTRYDYDMGMVNGWDTDWAIKNYSGNTSFVPTKTDPNYETLSDGTVISDILRLHQASFYNSATTNYHSLVDPVLLKNTVGSITLSYWIRKETTGTSIRRLRFTYSDGSLDYGDGPDLADNLSWQYFTVTSNPAKTVTGVTLGYNYSTWVRIGNVQVSVTPNAWDNAWLLANQHITPGYQAAFAVNNDVPNGVYNIVQLHHGDFYTGTMGVYSLVDPELLRLGGDNITLTYSVKRISPDPANLTVNGLRFRYSDGSGSAVATIALHSNWQTFSLTSAVGKTVVAVELVWYYGEYLHLGNVFLKTQYMGRADGRLSGETVQNGHYSKYIYDALGRVETSAITANKTSATEYLKETYTYVDGANNNTSYTVSNLNIMRGAANIVSYNYTYNMDNALLGTNKLERANPYDFYQIKEGTTLKAEYHYDALGRLARENSAYTNQTVTYTYDANNNILSKTAYALAWGNGTLSGGTVKSYTYADGTYKDRLTSYNGQSVTYDTLGNPLSYLGKTLTWTGRELSTYTNSGALTTYKYDANGIRLSKTAGSTVTNYLYNDSSLIRQSNGADTIWYLYDQNGMIGFQLNGTTYYYVRNLQGDVMRIINTSGTAVATYTYDAWGKCTVGTNTNGIADKNPIRYRGYYYDVETGFYYLNSRYYDPEVGRFISPDVLAEGGNLYAYCQNDPINRSDESGSLSKGWKKILSAAAVIVTTVAIVAVSAAFCGPASPYIAGAAVGAGMEMLQQIAFQDKDLSTINYAKVGVAAGSGALSAIPGLGWVGAGLISGGTAAAMTAIDGGSTKDIVRSAAIGFATGAVINKLFSSGMCFVEGTAVLTEDGALVIEAIAVGMLVYAYDDATGDVALKPVMQLFRNETNELTTVETSDGQEIISTPTHPYYTVNRGWLAAKDLRAGDILLLVNGKTVVVEYIQHEILEAPVKVYNFEVADYHTYYVAESVTASIDNFVLVHNKCETGGTKDFSVHESRNAAFRAAKRDAGIPMSQQPTSVTQSVNRAGQAIPGRTYSFGDDIIMEHAAGHIEYGMTRHFNFNGWHYFF